MYLFVEYGKRFNFRDLNETVLMHQDIGFGPQYINYERQIEYSTLAKEAIRDTLSDEAISEEMRILYVALTRAKEKLIMVGTQKEVEKQMQIKQELLELIPIGENKLAHQIVGRYKTYIDWLELVYLKSKQEKQEVLELFCHQTKDVLQEAIKIGAPKIIIVHNHPSGDPTPSKSDYDFTDRMIQASNIMGVELLDHIVIGEYGFKSIFYIKSKNK